MMTVRERRHRRQRAASTASGHERPRHRRHRGLLRRRLPQRHTGAPSAELHRPRSGAPELGADSRLRAGHPREVLRSSVAGRRGLVGMGAARDTARRHAASHARRDHLRRRGRCHRVGALLPRAGPARGRRRRRRRASAGRASSRSRRDAARGAMILVAGGSGRLGSFLVQRLVAGGTPVRVLTRVRARAAHLRNPRSRSSRATSASPRMFSAPSTAHRWS